MLKLSTTWTLRLASCKQTNRLLAFQRLRNGLGVIGMLAALFALPLLVKDITQSDSPTKAE